MLMGGVIDKMTTIEVYDSKALLDAVDNADKGDIIIFNEVQGR